MARLNLDGSIDPTFTAKISKSMSNFVSVDSLPLASGKVLVWGDFDTVDQTTRRGVALLNSNGSVDASFVPAINNVISYTNEIRVLSAAAQTDGKIIIGGDVLNNNIGRYRTYTARLNADGSFDRVFNQGKDSAGSIYGIKINRGNRLLIGGSFFRFNGVPRRSLAQIRL